MPSRKKFIVSTATLIVAGFGIFGILLWWIFSPVNASDISVRQITVPKGASVTAIANQLEEKGIVRSSLVLRLMLRGKNSTATIQSGTYELSPAMAVGQIADQLLQGSKDSWVTLLEGWRSEEISDELTRVYGLRYFNPDQFLMLAKPMEGKLFPDTYLFPKQTSAASVVAKLVDTFNEKYSEAKQAVGTGVLSDQETIVLASLVEREAKSPADKKMVAGILLNRIQAGIPLQVDATLQYAKGYDSVNKTWWPQPKAADKSLPSPFNTYLNKGLPPSPICNPGMDALEAALKPTKTNYLFYLTDHNGKMHYALTLEQHNANVELYLK